jgi:hypothetical protein
MAFGQAPMLSSHASTLNNSAASGAPLAVQPATVATKPAVRVNGAVLTEADVVREMYMIFPYAQQHNGFPKALEPEIRKGAIEMIIFEELIYQEAKRLKVPMAPEQLSKAEDAFRRQFASKTAYDQYLQNACAGSNRVLREKIRRSLLIEKMLQTQVEEKSVITIAEAKAYYDNNANKFQKPESYRIQTISIIPPQNGGAAVEKEARKRAEEAYERAKATKTYQDFGLLAEKISEDDWHVNMGDRKFVEASKLPPPVVKAAAAMKPGEVSNLIQLGNAYTIFRLVEHASAGRTSFEAVRAELQSDLQKQKRAELRAALNQKLRKDAKIEVL